MCSEYRRTRRFKRDSIPFIKAHAAANAISERNMTTALRRLGCSFVRRFSIYQPVLVLTPSSTAPTDGDEVDAPPATPVIGTATKEHNREFLQYEIRQGHSRSIGPPESRMPVLGSNRLLGNHGATTEWQIGRAHV